MSTETEQIEFRRSKTMDLASQGLSQRQIATVLQVSAATINSDLQWLRQEAQDKLGHYIQNLPFRHQAAVAGLDKIISEAWLLFNKHQDNPKIQLQALTLVADTIIKQQQMLGDSSQIERALQAVGRIKATIRGVGHDING